MKKFRRSTKSSDKTDSVSSGKTLFVPQKDAIAIVPPKKVIKALCDYTPSHPSPSQDYLSFSQGDFLHVVARENDPDWYEACNPLHGQRGLVPVSYFETVGKQVRASNGFEHHSRSQSQSQPMAGHDSGYAEKTAPQHRTSASNPVPPMNGGFGGNNLPRASKMAQARVGGGAMVYGIVQYDFKAERPDELEAKAGEAIIVIAQSNPEWFVAKPIQRLGGPGLIPVSFIEVRDMTTGHAVDDPHAAVQRAGVPKVEEWKRMAAEYKNSSIPLGRLDNSQGGLAQSMDRLSINSARQSQDAGRGSYQGHQRAGSARQSHGNQYRSSQLLSPHRARVPRYCHNRDEFWFIVEAAMEDGRNWDLSRSYKDFYNLQTALKEAYPEAAGLVENCPRTLPLMPGPLPWVTENLTAERRSHLDRYLKELLQISPQITTSHAVRGFFAPRDSDVQVEREEGSDSEWVRLSQGSSQQSMIEKDSRQSSTGNVSTTMATGYSSPSRQQQQQQPHQSQGPYGHKQPPGHYRNQSDLRMPQPPPVMRNNSAMTSNSNVSQHSGGAANSNQTPVKIKVWFGESNCVVIRLPPTFSYPELVQKLKDRWSLDGVDKNSVKDTDFIIEWRDESSGQYYKLDSEDELQAAKENCDKMTLRVGAVAAM